MCIYIYIYVYVSVYMCEFACIEQTRANVMYVERLHVVGTDTTGRMDGCTSVHAGHFVETNMLTCKHEHNCSYVHKYTT